MGFDKVFKACKSVEKALDDLGASGKGLHEKLSSIESTLSSRTVKTIRYIASVRNQLAHEEGFQPKDVKPNFIQQCEDIVDELRSQRDRLQSRRDLRKDKTISTSKSDASLPSKSSISSANHNGTPASGNNKKEKRTTKKEKRRKKKEKRKEYFQPLPTQEPDEPKMKWWPMAAGLGVMIIWIIVFMDACTERTSKEVVVEKGWIWDTTATYTESSVNWLGLILMAVVAGAVVYFWTSRKWEL